MPHFAVASTSSAASSLLNGLNEAANQQATQQRLQKDKQDADYRTGLQKNFDNQRLLANEGYVPTQTYANGDPLPGRPTLMTAEDNPAAQGGGPTITDPDGRQYTKKPAVDDTNSVTLSDDLAAQYQKAGIKNAKAGVKYPGTMVDHFNSVLGMYNKAAEPEEVEPAPGKFQGPDGKPAMLYRGKKTGKLQAAQLPEGYTAADAPNKEPRREDRADWVRIATDPASAPAEQRRAQAALDLDQKMKAKDNQPEINARFGERQENRQQDLRDRAQKQIDVFQTREQEEHQKIREYGKVLSNPNTVSKESNQLPVLVVDPKTGREVTMTEARRQEFQSQFDRATAMADNWHQQTVKLVQRHGGDTGAAQTPAQQPAQRSAAQLSTGHKVGDSVTLKTGKTIRISKINSDGSFEGQ